jgi:hypothetical protein
MWTDGEAKERRGKPENGRNGTVDRRRDGTKIQR